MAPRQTGTANSREHTTMAGAEIPVRRPPSSRAPAQTHDRLADEINRLASSVKAGDLNFRIPEEGFEGRALEAVKTLNGMLEAIAKPIDEVKAVLGRLAVNDLSGHVTGTYPGAFGEVAAATNLAQQRVKHTIEILNHLAAGDFKKDLEELTTVQRRSENDTLVPAFLRAMQAINAVLTDAEALSVAAVEGKLKTTVDAGKHQGDFRRIVEGMNSILGAVANPVAVSASYVERISNGDIPEKITAEYRGDFNAIKQSLNRCIDTLDTLLKQMAHMSQQHELGDIDVTIDSGKFEGAFRSVAQGINEMVGTHISVKKKAMACIAEFGKGNFDAPLEKFPGKKAFINDTIERLRTNLQSFIAEMKRMSEEHTKGDIEVVIPEEKFEGAYRAMAEGVNDMVAGHISVKKKAMACIAEFGKGNFDAPLEKFPGKKAFINETIEQVRIHLKQLITDMNALVSSATEGKLSVRADATRQQGDFRRIVEGVNQLLDATLLPIEEGNRVLRQIRGGNLRERVDIECKGDHQKMKDAINGVHDWLKGLVEYVTGIANGDMSAQMQKASEQDQIFEWLVLLKGNIVQLQSELGRLITAAKDGDLVSRGDPAKFKGAYSGVDGLGERHVRSLPLDHRAGRADEPSAERVGSRAQPRRPGDGLQRRANGFAGQHGIGRVGASEPQHPDGSHGGRRDGRQHSRDRQEHLRRHQGCHCRRALGGRHQPHHWQTGTEQRRDRPGDQGHYFDCPADQPAGLERHHRSGTRG